MSLKVPGEQKSGDVTIELQPPPRSPAPQTKTVKMAPKKTVSLPRDVSIDEGVEMEQQNLHRAAQDGDKDELQNLLQNGANPSKKDANGKTPLHYAVSTDCGCTDCVNTAIACTEILLTTQMIDVNAQDAKGNTALHYAIVNQLSKCAELLLAAGADVNVKGNSGEESVTLLVSKLPDTMTHLLNECIFVGDEHGPKDLNCIVKVDFSPLVGTPKFKGVDGKTGSVSMDESAPGRKDLKISWQREMRMMLDILENPATTPWRPKILTHPVVQIFMNREWKRARKFFLCSILLYLFYVCLLTWYIVDIYLYHCPLLNKTEEAKKKNFEGCDFNDNSTITECCRETGAGGLVITIIVLTVFLSVAEVLLVVITPKLYFRSALNYVMWVFIVLVMVTTIPNLWHQSSIGKVMHEVAAATAFIAWVFILHQISRFPSLGKYIEMFLVVLRSFGFFFVTFLTLFIAFAVSFLILFPKTKGFHDFPSSVAKVFVMMTGEIEYNDIFYDDGDDNKDQNCSCGAEEAGNDAAATPYFEHILIGAFIFICTIVLMNLVVGLTVQDIQKLETDGEVRRTSRLIREIHRLELIVFSKRVPRMLADRLKASISVIQPSKHGRREGLIFDFCPNMLDDTSLPEYLKEEALKLATMSYERDRSQNCTKSAIASGSGNSGNYPAALLRRMNRQHYNFITAKAKKSIRKRILK